MKSVKAFLLAGVLVAGACASEATQPEQAAGTPQQAQVGDTIRLRVGGMAQVGAVTVAFRHIVADSRCPIDALCVWAGNAEARIDFSTGNAPWTQVSLHSYQDPKQVEFGSYVFKLIEVAPPNVSTQTTKPADYVVALEVRNR